MKIIIDKNYLFEKNSMTIGNSNNVVDMKAINNLKKIMFKEEIKTIESYFFKIKESLNCNSDDLKKVISQKNKNIYFDYLKKEIFDIKKYISSYIFDIHKQKLNLFKKIKTIPGDELPIYDDYTKTGRMRITSGTSYITMKKEDRKKIKIDDRVIFEIDFKSCEPSFYLFSNDIIKPCNDVYSEMMSLINQDIKREKFKVGFLSLMYGGSDEMVKKISGLSTESIATIKEKIKIEEFKNRLKNSINDDNILLNYYGRPIIANSNMINYFIQSSSADFYCLAFNKLLNERKDITLHACIHDAILCSIDKKYIDSLKNIKFLDDGITNLKLPVNIEIY